MKCIDSDETINTTKAHEPFRNAMPSDTDILYKWSCLCRVCLDKGFCAHVFFCEHHIKRTKIPEAACAKALSGRMMRRGRPPIELMGNALERERALRRRIADSDD